MAIPNENSTFCTRRTIKYGSRDHQHGLLAFATFDIGCNNEAIFCTLSLPFNSISSIMSLCAVVFSVKKIYYVHFALEQVKYGCLIEIVHGNDKTTLINSFLSLFKLISRTFSLSIVSYLGLLLQSLSLTILPLYLPLSLFLCTHFLYVFRCRIFTLLAR